MDTVEELKGTYFFNGIINLNAGELFFYIFFGGGSEKAWC